MKTILDSISCAGACLFGIYLLAIFLSNFSQRPAMPPEKTSTDEPRRPMTDRDRWCEGMGGTDVGDLTIGYQDEAPKNGRGRLVFDPDERGEFKPHYQVLGRSYRTKTGTRTLWDSDDYLTDGS